jgi:hypothetical protein
MVPAGSDARVLRPRRPLAQGPAHGEGKGHLNLGCVRQPCRWYALTSDETLSLEIPETADGISEAVRHEISYICDRTVSLASKYRDRAERDGIGAR